MCIPDRKWRHVYLPHNNGMQINTLTHKNGMLNTQLHGKQSCNYSISATIFTS